MSSFQSYFKALAPVVQKVGSVIHRINNPIQWLSINKIHCVILWIVIYLVDSAMQPFEPLNRGLQEIRQ